MRLTSGDGKYLIAHSLIAAGIGDKVVERHGDDLGHCRGSCNQGKGDIAVMVIWTQKAAQHIRGSIRARPFLDPVVPASKGVAESNSKVGHIS